ncbi:MAG: hypothetical protein JNK12_17910 [Acidimicrobiales bacterium]|nr:hypothetical protein [Acidimicrobiales bacterium]
MGERWTRRTTATVAALAATLTLASACSDAGSSDETATDDLTTTSATAQPTTAASGPEDDFAEQADAACTELNDQLAGGVEAALLSTRDLANSVQTTDPAALEPVFSSIEASFGDAADLVAGLQADFAAIDGPSEAEAPLADADEALTDVEQRLRSVEQAGADQDLAGVGQALDAVNSYDAAPLTGALDALAALGATACQTVD